MILLQSAPYRVTFLCDGEVIAMFTTDHKPNWATGEILYLRYSFYKIIEKIHWGSENDFAQGTVYKIERLARDKW